MICRHAGALMPCTALRLAGSHRKGGSARSIHQGSRGDTPLGPQFPLSSSRVINYYVLRLKTITSLDLVSRGRQDIRERTAQYEQVRPLHRQERAEPIETRRHLSQKKLAGTRRYRPSLNREASRLGDVRIRRPSFRAQVPETCSRLYSPGNSPRCSIALT